jgi:anti-sigma regulatory factor (Ser/Thr protein kinase)
MSGDASLRRPGGGAGRAISASPHTPILDQEFDSGTLYALRSAVQAHADLAGLPEDRASEVVLAVHELAANAIAHGAGHGRLRIWDLADALSCEVVDAGRAGGPAEVRGPDAVGGPDGVRGPDAVGGPDGVRGPDTVRGPDAVGGSWAVTDPWPVENGHGLWLVRQVADQLDLRSGPRGTRAVVTFALPRPRGN